MKTSPTYFKKVNNLLEQPKCLYLNGEQFVTVQGRWEGILHFWRRWNEYKATCWREK